MLIACQRFIINTDEIRLLMKTIRTSGWAFKPETTHCITIDNRIIGYPSKDERDAEWERLRKAIWMSREVRSQ